MASPSPTQDHALRDGELDDVDQVMTVMEAAFGDLYGEAWTRSQLLGILPMAGVVLTVAVNTRDGSTAGFSLARSVADEAELLLIAVHPDDRRLGIGARLLDHFLAMARDSGRNRVHLEVRDGNPAVKLYTARGFAPVGRRKAYYQGRGGDRHDAVTLARNLD